MTDFPAVLMADARSIIGGLLIGFACGSIPFGYLLVRLKTGEDVRQAGSGNIGATNVSRALGVKGGVITLVLDVAKGAMAVIAAAYIGAGVGVGVFGIEEVAWPAAGALGAVLGHCYTPWLRLRGGKGVATLIGAFGVLAPAATAIGVAVLLLVAAITRMMSLASLVGASTLALATYFLDGVPYTTTAASLAAAVIIWRHRANVGRLVRGEETRMGGAHT